VLYQHYILEIISFSLITKAPFATYSPDSGVFETAPEAPVGITAYCPDFQMPEYETVNCAASRSVVSGTLFLLS